MRLIDKVSHGDTREMLMKTSLLLSRSDRIRSTPVASRRLSSAPLKGVVSNEANLIYENKVTDQKDPVKLSVLAAVKAAYLCGSFEEGLEMEANILSVLSKTEYSKAKQYHFFTNRLSRHADTCAVLHNAIDYHRPESLLLYLSKPNKNIPLWGSPGARSSDVLKNVTILGMNERSLVIAKMCARKGSAVHILEVLQL